MTCQNRAQSAQQGISILHCALIFLFCDSRWVGACHFDHLWLFSSSPTFPYTFCPPASTTLPNLKVSSGSSSSTVRPSLPAFWMTFSFLVGLKSANISVSALAARSLLPVFMQASCLSSISTELICWSYCRIYLPLGCCRMLWWVCTVIHPSCSLPPHSWSMQW